MISNIFVMRTIFAGLSFYITNVRNSELSSSVGKKSQGIGQYVGDICNETCSLKLFRTYCNSASKLCECEIDYPVNLSNDRGCAKVSTLGEQCLYSESCSYYDPYATCIQIKHNAFCQCITGYHVVTLQKSMRKEFCTQDLIQITTDLNTLLLVIGGLIVFSTLICFVLKLFVGFRSSAYRNATITTRLLSTSEIAQVARSLGDETNTHASRRTTYSRRGSQGVMVSSSRATAARAAAILLVSCHIPQPDKSVCKSSDSNTGSTLLIQNSSLDSPRSYSAKQFKREWDQRQAAKSRKLSIQKSSSMDQFSSFIKSTSAPSTSHQFNNEELSGTNEHDLNDRTEMSQSSILSTDEQSKSR